MFLFCSQKVKGHYMVETTNTNESICKPLDDLRAGAPEIEITDDMINAGIEAFYRRTNEGWASPGGEEMRSMIAAICVAILSQLHHS
jgi:hypothetical protein